MIKVSAFRSVPKFAWGQVRDLRVRWALEEAGRPYAEWLIGPEEQRSAAYLACQPFGQVPAVEIDGTTMFESGAIVLRIAEGCDALMPADPEGRHRAISWMFAALNSVEPPVQRLGELIFFRKQPWVEQARPAYTAAVEKRLDALANRLAGRDHLDGRFTAADLLMTTVLRGLDDTDLVVKRPALATYKARCESRPAFAKALAAQLRPFEEAERTRSI